MNRRVQASHLEVGNVFYHSTEPEKEYIVQKVDFRYGKVIAKEYIHGEPFGKNIYFSRGATYYYLINH